MADEQYGGSDINSDVDAVAAQSAIIPSAVEEVDCKRCGKTFPDSEELRRHKVRKGHFSCDHCDKTFYHPQSLMMHHRQLHYVAPKLFCPCCKLAFTTGAEFFLHIENNSCRGISAASVARRREKMLDFSRNLSHSIDPVDLAEQYPTRHIDPGNTWQDWTKENNNNVSTVGASTFGQAMGGYGAIVPDNAHKVYYQPGDFPAVQTREAEKLNAGNTGSIVAKRPPVPGTVSYNAVPPPASYDLPSTRNPPRQLETTDPNKKIRFMKEEDLPVKPGTTLSETGARIIDPDHPDFNASVFYVTQLEKYVCPHSSCRAKIGTASALRQHLKSARHGQGSIGCPGCRKTFFMVHQMIAHTETTQSCGARESDCFPSALGQATGGLMSVDSTIPGPSRFVVDQRVLQDLLDNWQ
ncbi:hypothetical protein F5Y18DRAFT_425886 [Xylariaceae sp. FL1019]|nr:hypothetical protein F5Y18DRAFT_425886 [Xylariaceae sp. FL1019]